MKFEIYLEEGKHTFNIPIKVITSSYLDEMLDMSPIEVRDTNIERPFPPFTKCAMYETETAQPVYWMVASDVVQEVKATGLHNHTVQLVEPTKWLERWMVGSKAITQPALKSYTPIKVEKTPEELNEYSDYFGTANNITWTGLSDSVEGYQTPYTVGDTATVYPIGKLTTTEGGIRDDFFFRIFKDNVLLLDSEMTDIPAAPSYLQITLSAGRYTVVYDWTWKASNHPQAVTYVAHAEYSFYVIPAQSTAKKTLRDAAQQFIWAAQSLVGAEPSVFTLTDNALAKLQGDAPELTVTNATLREALDEVGKCIGAITRLRLEYGEGNGWSYLIDFDYLCKNEKADLSELGNSTEIYRSQSCEDYCTALDATASNLVQYGDGGSVNMPTGADVSGFGLYKTPRTEDASYRVNEGTAEVIAPSTFERLDKAIVKIPSIGRSFDITSFVYESAEYGTLSSFSPTYPYSKAYALEYSIGSKSIRGLDFTVPNAVAEIFQTPAIVNIINTFLEDGDRFNNVSNLLDFTELQFRVTYVPTGEARIRMHKPNSVGKTESALAFNQSAAKLDTRAFGRNMFGAVLRMGNPQEQRSYVCRLGAKVPEIGQRIGANGFIAEVRQEFAAASKKVTLTVVEAFNRLSAFIGVNQQLRLFEISERMSLDRHVVWEDFCLISSSEKSGFKAPLCTSVLADRLKFIFTRSESLGNAVGNSFFEISAIAQGYDKSGTALTRCLLPCITYGVGNAFSAVFGYLDNYSAGRRIDDKSHKEVTNSDGNKEYFATQSDVQYGDFFGEIDELRLDLVTFNGTSMETNEAAYTAIANALPEFTVTDYEAIGMTAPAVVATTGNDRRLRVYKDGRECLKSVAYQLNFMQADGVIISPVIAELMQYFSAGNTQLRLLILDEEINEFTTYVDNTNGVNLPSESVTFSGNFPKISASISTSGIPQIASAKAWAIASYDGQRATFILGKNEDISRTSSITIYFNFFRK